MSDQPDADTCTRQHTKLTRDKHQCPRRDSKAQSQQASCHTPPPQTVRPPRSACFASTRFRFHVRAVSSHNVKFANIYKTPRVVTLKLSCLAVKINALCVCIYIYIYIISGNLQRRSIFKYLRLKFRKRIVHHVKGQTSHTLKVKRNQLIHSWTKPALICK